VGISLWVAALRSYRSRVQERLDNIFRSFLLGDAHAPHELQYDHALWDDLRMSIYVTPLSGG